MSGLKRIAFAGGGSGGHVYPLIAVADEMRRLDPALECFFVSTSGSIEEKLVPRAGYELMLIPSGKLKGQGLVKTVRTLFTLLFSFVKCAKLIRERKPQYVFSAGGYAGAPFMITAALMGIPCAILEQNRIPGLANRWMAKFCERIFLNFAASQVCFPGKETIVVGHPCRKELDAAIWTAAEAPALFQKKPFELFIFGGSQGAVGINRLVTAALPHLKELNIFLHHQTGAQDFPVVKAAYEKENFSSALVEPYVYDMTSAYRKAQLVLCRAGASSIAELAAVGKAAILIPLVSRDKHQEHNALEMQNLSACAVYLQPELTGEKLAAILKELYYNLERLAQYAEKIHSLHHPDSAAQIATVILGK
jgi:UDP-N-acetylglucosamine--N-acetylmuramyl-(pentapeptide) pyrophosphoryl-undecaprenol N-acetylglucosamine transferase